MKRKEMNIWLQLFIFLIGVPAIVIGVMALNEVLPGEIMLSILWISLLILIITAFFGDYILEKYGHFRLNDITFRYIDIDKLEPSMDLPKINDIETAYYIGGHVWIVQDSRIIVQTYMLKWIQNEYLIQVKAVKNQKEFQLLIKKDILEGSIAEKELFNMIKEMADENNIVTSYSMDKWMLKNRTRMTKWFKLLYKTCYEKVTGQKVETIINKNKEEYIYKVVPASDEMIEYAKSLMALKKYLDDSYGMEKREPVEIHLWNEYMLYASLFGITNKVENRLKSICPENVNYDREKNGESILREVGLTTNKVKVTVRGWIKGRKKEY